MRRLIRFVFWQQNPVSKGDDIIVKLAECEFRLNKDGKFPADLQALYTEQAEWINGVDQWCSTCLSTLE